MLDLATVDLGVPASNYFVSLANLGTSMSHSLNSLKSRDDIGDYYKGLWRGYWEFKL